MTIREIIKVLEMSGYDPECETNIVEIKHTPHEFVRLRAITATHVDWEKFEDRLTESIMETVANFKANNS